MNNFYSLNFQAGFICDVELKGNVINVLVLHFGRRFNFANIPSAMLPSFEYVDARKEFSRLQGSFENRRNGFVFNESRGCHNRPRDRLSFGPGYYAFGKQPMREPANLNACLDYWRKLVPIFKW